jgi:hypothetical protein
MYITMKIAMTYICQVSGWNTITEIYFEAIKNEIEIVKFSSEKKDVFQRKQNQ